MRKPYRLDEVRIDQLLSKAAPCAYREPVSTRSSGYSVTLRDMIIDDNPRSYELTYVFKVTKLGHGVYDVYVSLPSFWQFFEASGDEKGSFNAALDTGDVLIYCTCPSWLYGGYQYIASRNQYQYGQREERPPDINNPSLLGTLCKHSYRVLIDIDRYRDQMYRLLEDALWE